MRGSLLFALAGAMFALAAIVGRQPAFYGVAVMFVGTAAAGWLHNRG